MKSERERGAGNVDWFYDFSFYFSLFTANTCAHFHSFCLLLLLMRYLKQCMAGFAYEMKQTYVAVYVHENPIYAIKCDWWNVNFTILSLTLFLPSRHWSHLSLLQMWPRIRALHCVLQKKVTHKRSWIKTIEREKLKETPKWRKNTE